MKLLIVEDEKENRRILDQRVNRSGLWSIWPTTG